MTNDEGFKFWEDVLKHLLDTGEVNIEYARNLLSLVTKSEDDTNA